MAFDPGAISTTLAAAVGDDPQLVEELRLAFVESADRALAAMEQAPDAGAYGAAAARLKGLAASFGAVRLMALAGQAADGAAFDRTQLRKLRHAVSRL